MTLILSLLVVFICDSVPIYAHRYHYSNDTLFDNFDNTLSRSSSQNLSSIQPYIVGGSETTIEEHPYQVLIETRQGPKTFSRCGGAIVSLNVIVTAGHCVYNVDPEKMRVYAGLTFTNDRPDPISVLEAHSHPLYTGGYDYDIGIVVIDGQFKFGHKVKFIMLAPPSYRLAIGSLMTITGWGRLREELTSLPDTLQEVQVPIIPWNLCRDLYLKIRSVSPYPLDRKAFCAGDVEKGFKDACQGDSGSGAEQNGYLVGIVSWGLGCGRAYAPGVYSSVMHYRKWIVASILYYDREKAGRKSFMKSVLDGQRNLIDF